MVHIHLINLFSILSHFQDLIAGLLHLIDFFENSPQVHGSMSSHTFLHIILILHHYHDLHDVLILTHFLWFSCVDVADEVPSTWEYSSLSIWHEIGTCLDMWYWCGIYTDSYYRPDVQFLWHVTHMNGHVALMRLLSWCWRGWAGPLGIGVPILWYWLLISRYQRLGFNHL